MEEASPLCENECLPNEDLSPARDEDEIPGVATRGVSQYESDSSTGTSSSSSENSVGISWYKATFLIVNAALGAGVLNFPQAFKETGGLISGNVAHVIFVTFSLISLIMLSICGTDKNCKTYQDVVKTHCGPRWGVLSSICISLYCFVTCITFIIIIGDQFDRAFASYYGQHFCYYWYLNRKFTMVVASLLLVIPSCLKRIDGMQFMSYVGVASILYLLMVIVVEMVRGQYVKGEILIFDVDFWSFFNVVPTICFGYQCHVSSVPIMSCLKNREKPDIIKACVSSIILCFLAYSIAANCGYLTFGSYVSSDILLDYNARRLYVLFAVLLLAIKSWTTYPILLFCVREAVADIYLGMRKMDYVEEALGEPRRRKVIATLLWISTIIFAVFIPGLNVVVKLLGSLAGLFILTFPGMCYMNKILSNNYTLGREVFGPKQFLKTGVGVIYIILGVFTFGLALSMGIEGFLKPVDDDPVCVAPGWF